MYNDLTKIQVKILEFIKQELRDKGYPPSVREIGANVGLTSTSSVHNQLNNLEKKRYIKRGVSKQRAIEVVGFSPFSNKDTNYDEVSTVEDIINVPIIGNVAAGLPILAEENVEDTYPLPSSFVGTKECFMLHVKGESMKDAGILDGDMVIVKKQNTANNHDIVVALIENEATVKTFYKESNRIRLQPENPAFEPIYSTDCQILGKVIGVIRMFV